MQTPEGPACDANDVAQACVELHVGPVPASAVAAAPASTPEQMIAGVEVAASSPPIICPPCVAHVGALVAVGASVPPFAKVALTHVPLGSAVYVSALVHRMFKVANPDAHVTGEVGAPHEHAEHCAGAPDGSATPESCGAAYGAVHEPVPASASAMRSCTDPVQPMGGTSTHVCPEVQGAAAASSPPSSASSPPSGGSVASSVGGEVVSSPCIGWVVGSSSPGDASGMGARVVLVGVG